MKVNSKIRYGLKALLYIADEREKKELTKIRDIAKKENLSIQYLEQILFKLKNENIIEGKRGPKGGYRLNVDPKTVSLIRIYNILEDDEKKILRCNQEEGQCPYEICQNKCLWSKMNNAIKEVLESYTLEDIILDRDLVC